MKNILLLVVFFLSFHSSIWGQEKQSRSACYAIRHEEWPEFPGGYIAKNQFIAENFHYPPDAFREKIQGIVTIGFTVEKDGSLTEFTTLKSVYMSLDAEALRLAEIMPNWIPGRHLGIPIRTQHTIDIIFRLPIE